MSGEGDAPGVDGKGDGAARTMRVRRGGNGRAQQALVREDGWTPERRETFLQTLAETCNVREAAEAAGMARWSAYRLKQRDPGFARDWERALSIAYDELEAALLRDALFGHEEEEIVTDGEGVVKTRKIRRGRDRGMALRLLAAHRATAERLRGAAMRDVRDGAEVKAELRALLDTVRAKKRVRK